MKLVNDNIVFLKALAFLSSKKQRRQLIKYADRNQLRVLGEICSNILAGVIMLSKRDMAELKDHSEIIRSLENRDISDAKRKRLAISRLTTVTAVLRATIRSLKIK
jgi:hypothetical protein